mgnify:CR=1 FL=1
MNGDDAIDGDLLGPINYAGATLADAAEDLEAIRQNLPD